MYTIHLNWSYLIEDNEKKQEALYFLRAFLKLFNTNYYLK